ncbi:hypothetical protein ACFSHQ_16380 [Gemmobacter lanyuensis]
MAQGAGTRGTLDLTARLGKPVAVERLRLAAPGLTAEGVSPCARMASLSASA